MGIYREGIPLRWGLIGGWPPTPWVEPGRKVQILPSSITKDGPDSEKQENRIDCSVAGIEKLSMGERLFYEVRYPAFTDFCIFSTDQRYFIAQSQDKITSRATDSPAFAGDMNNGHGVRAHGTTNPEQGMHRGPIQGIRILFQGIQGMFLGLRLWRANQFFRHLPIIQFIGWENMRGKEII